APRIHSIPRMQLSPPTSTLFPYTTLFRSFEAVREERIAARLSSTAFGPALVPLPMLTAQPDRHRFAPSVLSALRRSSFFEQFDEDRKSTRLNSSHVKTSYAVFC